jgi:hypothetical protein
MKRSYTPQPYRVGHHERASIAVRIARLMRAFFKPTRLFLLAIEESNAEAHFANVVAKLEAGARELMSARREMARLEAKRMQIERGLT